MAIIDLNNENFEENVNASVPVLVDFWASWCGPCRALGPIIEEVSNDYEDGSARFCKVNVDEQPKLAQRFMITTIPTVMIFKEGKILDQIIGLRDKDEIKAFVEKQK